MLIIIRERTCNFSCPTTNLLSMMTDQMNSYSMKTVRDENKVLHLSSEIFITGRNRNLSDPSSIPVSIAMWAVADYRNPTKGPGMQAR